MFADDVRKEIAEAQHYMCCVAECVNRIDDFHHALHNTVANRKLFPKLIDSVFNCRGVCRMHHDNYSSHNELNMSIDIAKLYEQHLTKGI
jgi:hypothetical protein